MATHVTALTRIPRVVDSGSERPFATARQDTVTILLALWAMLGVFIDGWAHSEIIETIESFFTPWHAVLYSGFTGAGGWILYQVLSRQERGEPFDLARIPVGYGLGLVGAAVFGLAGIGDMTWHTLFGIEVGTEALLSPTHFGLFSGLGLMLSVPLRANWAARTEVDRSFGSFFPTLLSVTLTAAGTAFFLMYLSPFTERYSSAELMNWLRFDGLMPLAEQFQELGVAGFLMTSIVFVAPLLLMARRWRLPFGSATFLMTIIAVGMSGLEGFDGGETIMAAGIGGLTADVILRKLVVGPSPVCGLRVMAAVVPAVTWTVYFGIVAAFWGLGWVVEFWSGTIVLSALVGFAIAYLMTVAPPPREGAL